MKYNQGKRVIIDCFPESARRYRGDCAVVAIDVIRATSTAVTAVARGRRCFPVSTIEDALSVAKNLENPLLAGELGGNMPYGFHITNSPAEVARRSDVHRPLVLLSSAGTQLIHEAQGCKDVYLACFRNYHALALYLADRYYNVAVIGAGTRGEFREEDQMCCAWVAEILVNAGYTPASTQTKDLIRLWSGASPEACLGSKSVEYLRKSGQEDDLEFILSYINDLDHVFLMVDNEVVAIPAPERRPSLYSRSRIEKNIDSEERSAMFQSQK